METCMLKEIHEQPEVIRRSYREVRPQIREMVSSLRMRDVEYVVITARGTSDHAAVYGKYVIEYLTGIPVALAAPSIVTLYERKLYLENALVIGVSQSGEAADVHAYLQAARDTGAVTLTITNEAESAMARDAEHLLLCGAGKEEAVAATKTYTAEIALMAMLAAELGGFPEISDQLEQAAEQMEQVLARESEVEAVVERYRYMDHCAVLGRGLNYATALETALKLKETCYVIAEGASSADFLHGPIALVQPGFPTIVFALDDSALPATREIIQKLLDIGAEVIIISDKTELARDADRFLRLPVPCRDVLSPLISIVTGQLFSNFLAVSKNLNPDAPRIISKVTITR